MSNIGYIRVSSADQNTERQLDGIELDKVFTEKASGKDRNRPELQAMLQYARSGDVIHVHSIDRLGRSIIDLKTLVSDLNDRGVSVHFHKENMTFSVDVKNPMNELMFNMLASFAEFERAMIKERQREGIEKAKANDKSLPIKERKYKGRKPKDNKDLMVKDIESGMSYRAVSVRYNVGVATVKRAVDEKKTNLGK